MPNKDFLETYDLYRPFPMKLPATFAKLPKPAINMWCLGCKSVQTFSMYGSYTDNLVERVLMPEHEVNPKGFIISLRYRCAACNFLRIFLVAFDPAGLYIEKVGQFPKPDISIDHRVQKLLDDKDVTLYKNGRICEAHGYGIGAFAYYRRLLENVISKLLDEITDLVPEEDKRAYLAGLEKVRSEKNAEDKVHVAKDILPQTLKSVGLNPLSTLYDALSGGLHVQTDAECLEIAVKIRAVFDALVIQIDADKATSKVLTEGTKNLLREKSRAFSQ